MQTETVQPVIPVHKQAAVERALQASFGTTAPEKITLLSGGLSTALVYKIIVRGKAYILRLIMKQDEFNDPARHFTCMKTAAEAGIAPFVHYTNVEDALSITDFIEHHSLFTAFGNQEERLLELVRMIKAIHNTKLFPPLVNFLDGVDMFIEQYKQLNILPESVTEKCFRLYEQVQQYYPKHDEDLVSSHNDLNPNNILFDGKKLWIIDWEAAFRNDRYVDLAIISKSFVQDEHQEQVFLEAYFGVAMNEYKRARFFLMQQVCNLYYGTTMLRLAANKKQPGYEHDADMNTVILKDFHRQISTGTVALATYEAQLMYGKVLLNEALRNMETNRFTAAIEIMKGALNE